MKLKYTFDVVSDLALPARIRYSIKNTTFTLESHRGRFSKLIVEVKGVAMNEFPRMEPSIGGLPKMTIPKDPVFDEVQSQVRTLQGVLRLWSVHSIDLQYPKHEWIPETQHEITNTGILAHQFSRSKPGSETNPVTHPLDLILRSLVSLETFSGYELVFEFHRRGLNDIGEERYIEAIYDFYLLIEYLYSNGKTSRKETLKAFCSHAELCKAVEVSKLDPMQQLAEPGKRRDEFIENYVKKSCECILDDIIGLRGFLLHQTLKRKENWNPGIQNKYTVQALFLCRVCHEVTIRLFTTVVNTPVELEKYKRVRVTQRKPPSPPEL